MAGLFYTLLAVLAVFFPGLYVQTWHAGMAPNNRPYTSVLTVRNGGPWGDWAWREMCPINFFAVGFSVRVEQPQGRGDDTALNGIRLYCAKYGNRNHMFFVESHTGFFGDWSQPQYCPSGVLTSFQLRVEPRQGSGDDTAANNIKFRCSSNHVLEGQGTRWGEYSHWSPDCGEGGICGIETKMEEKQGDGDDTCLNDVHFYCCS